MMSRVRHRDVPRRTTLILDDDIARKASEQPRKTGKPFRAVINGALRIGLNPPRPRRRQPFSVSARSLKLRDGLMLDSIEGILDQIDGASRR